MIDTAQLRRLGKRASILTVLAMVGLLAYGYAHRGDDVAVDLLGMPKCAGTEITANGIAIRPTMSCFLRVRVSNKGGGVVTVRQLSFPNAGKGGGVNVRVIQVNGKSVQRQTRADTAAVVTVHDRIEAHGSKVYAAHVVYRPDGCVGRGPWSTVFATATVSTEWWTVTADTPEVTYRGTQESATAPGCKTS